MVVCNDENANYNTVLNRGSDVNVKPSVVSAGKQSEGLKVPGAEGKDSTLKFGPSFQEWASHRQPARQQDDGGSSQQKSRMRTFVANQSPAPSAGRSSKVLHASNRQHFSSNAGVSSQIPKVSSRQHFPTKDVLFRMGSEDVEQITSVKKQQEEEPIASAATIDFSSPNRPYRDAAWSQSLRESGPPQAWTPQITVPFGPRFSTPNRSRSTSVRSCTPNRSRCATPEASETPRDRSVSWEHSLRGRGRAPAAGGRAASVDNTPQRRKRRSLSHWWAESSAPAKVTSRSNLSTPRPAAMTPDCDDAVSDKSVTDHQHASDPVVLLNNMSHLKKRLSVERKRNQLDEMTREELSSESSTPLGSVPSCPPMSVSNLGPLSTGSQSWLRSLRRGGSCPPSTHSTSSLTLGREPKMHTAQRASSRTDQRSVEKFAVGSMSESQHLHPRERAALDKHLERAASRSCSTQRSTRSLSARRSASATPERRTSQTPNLRERAAVERHLERATAGECAAQRSRSETPQRSASTTPEHRTSSLNPRQRAALERHRERMGLAQQSAGTTPKQHTIEGRFAQNGELSTGRQLSRPREREKNLEGSTAPAHPSVMLVAAHTRQQKHSQVPALVLPVAQSVSELKSQAPGASEAPAHKPEAKTEEEWVRKATNPEERAARARKVTQAKVEQVQAHERARVFVFKKSTKPKTPRAVA